MVKANHQARAATIDSPLRSGMVDVRGSSTRGGPTLSHIPLDAMLGLMIKQSFFGPGGF